jgi:hypothetical protein
MPSDLIGLAWLMIVAAILLDSFAKVYEFLDPFAVGFNEFLRLRNHCNASDRVLTHG